MSDNVSSEALTPDLLEPGAVVRLKSGGPGMTVESSTDGDVTCVWFGDDGRPLAGPFRETFQRTSLQRA